MRPQFSKIKFSAYVDAYVAHSKSLGADDHFNREDIAKEVFGKKDKHAAQHFSAAYSPGNRTTPLREYVVKETLDVCSRLLHAQYQRLRVSSPDTAVMQFEQQLCRQHRICEKAPATCDDFLAGPLIETATSMQDFGLPDILKWADDSFDFATELLAVQRRGIDVLRSIRDFVACCQDERRRLQLAYIAVSVSMLNHPGSKWHDDAFDLAMEVACLAQVPRLALARHIPEDIRLLAIRLDHQLQWNRIAPTLDSPTNYMTYALQGQPIPGQLWTEARHFLDASIIGIRRQFEIEPGSERAILELSSALSMKARMLLVAGSAADMSEADELARESVRGIERIHAPYGFVYPILKDIVRGKYKYALPKIEQAIAAHEEAGSTSSAAAFAALHIHVGQLYGKSPTKDKHIRKLATKAVTSAGIRYKYSQVFNPAAVRRLLYPGTATTPRH